MTDRQEFGRAAEDDAANYLLSLGYTLVTRRYKVREGEIDLICLDGDTLVFVEVKARYSNAALPEESVGDIKIQRLQRAAQVYRERIGDSRLYRFDVIAIDASGLRHHKHIFAQ